MDRKRGISRILFEYIVVCFLIILEEYLDEKCVNL